MGESASKMECLYSHVEDILKADREHHFVVFTTKQEALDLGKYFEKKGYKDYYSNDFNTGNRTYRVITGDNSKELENFGSKDSTKNPTVLFVNYQVAEQGVNLPGFDYVVNYQISRYPSRLEQRFGRIDRLDKNGDSKYEVINICYVLSNNLFDTSTRNFYIAVDAYLDSIIPFLPSRNMILNDIILSEMESVVEETKRRLLDMQSKLEKGEEIFIERKKANSDEEETTEIEKITDKEIIYKWIRELDSSQSTRAEKVELARTMGIIKDTDISDEIFVKFGDGKIKTFTNVDCKNSITCKDIYKEYNKFISSLDAKKIKDLHERKVTHAVNCWLIMAYILGEINLSGDFECQMQHILQIQSDQCLEEMAQKINTDDSLKERTVAALVDSMKKWELTEWGNIGWEPVLNLSENDKRFLIENTKRFLMIIPGYEYFKNNP